VFKFFYWLLNYHVVGKLQAPTGSPFNAPPQGILPNRSGTAAHVVGYQVRLPGTTLFVTGFSDSGTDWKVKFSSFFWE